MVIANEPPGCCAAGTCALGTAARVSTTTTAVNNLALRI
jgi:hypothetical protein